MKRTVAALLLVPMMLMSACSNAGNEEAPQLLDSISVAYDTVEVERGDVVALIVYDTYVTPVITEVEPDGVSGMVDEIFVRVGDEVAVGTPLFKLDTEMLDKRLEAQRETLEQLMDGGALNRRLLEIDLELAKLSLEETKEQGDATAVSLAELEIERCENALSDYDVQYGNQTAAIRERISELESDIAAYTLCSPAAGRVVTLPAGGAYVSSATAAARIASEEGRYLCCDGTGHVPQDKRLYAVLDGEETELVQYGYTDRENAIFEARHENPPQRFLRADDGELPPSGTYVQLKAERERANDTLRLPYGAVRTEGSISYVYRMEGSEKVYTEVKTGVSSSAYVEILEGLSEEDVVYVGN